MVKELNGLTILGYIFGVLILLAGIGSLIQLKVLTGFFYIIAGGLITPIIFHTLTKKSTLPLSRGARVVVAIVFIALGGIFYW